MSTKGIGTTVDATAIPVSCKSINSNQNLPISNNNQQDIQTKINHSKRGEFWRWGARKVFRRWEKTMLQEMRAIKVALGSEAERPCGSSKNET